MSCIPAWRPMHLPNQMYKKTHQKRKRPTKSTKDPPKPKCVFSGPTKTEMFFKRPTKKDLFPRVNNSNFKLKLKINSDEIFDDFKPYLHLMKILICTCNFLMRVDPGEI